jgi:hypothetical protein
MSRSLIVDSLLIVDSRLLIEGGDELPSANQQSTVSNHQQINDQ